MTTALDRQQDERARNRAARIRPAFAPVALPPPVQPCQNQQQCGGAQLGPEEAALIRHHQYEAQCRQLAANRLFY